MVLVALTLGLPASVGAQDAGVQEPSEEEPEPEEAPRVRALPVEDPTRHPARDEGLQVEDDQDPAPEGEGDEPEDLLSETQDDQLPTGLTTGAVPIEDPTLRQSTEEEPTDEAEPTEEQPPAEPKDEPAAEQDGGSNVEVAYDGGFLLSVDDWFFLTLGGLVQARYTVNYRTNPPTDPDTLERDKQVTQGFDVARGRFTLGIGLTEFVALVMRIGVVAGGSFEFQRAFIDLKWKFLRLRAGLFMNELFAESFINPHDLLFLDYSIVENVYSPGSSAGIMFTYLRPRFSINLGYSNGLRTGFSEIRDPAQADFAVTLRAQYAWGKIGLSGFNRLNSRRGTPFGVRLGVAAHYQDGGRSGESLPVKIALFTADLVVKGNGWSATLMGAVGQDSTDPTASNEAGEIVTSGVSLMGGYFVLENLEVFAQYSIVTKPKIRGDLPPTVTEELAEPSNFQSFGVGFSYWIIRGHDNVKLSSDFQYFLGREAGSTVPTSPLNSIQPNDAGSQFSWRIQLSAHF
jgi:hypothetical protein